MSVQVRLSIGSGLFTSGLGLVDSVVLSAVVAGRGSDTAGSTGAVTAGEDGECGGGASSGTGLPAARSRTICWSRSLRRASGSVMILPSLSNVTSPSSSRINSARIVRPSVLVQVRSPAIPCAKEMSASRTASPQRENMVKPLVAKDSYQAPAKIAKETPIVCQRSALKSKQSGGYPPAFQWATSPLRRARFAKCAAEAALTPASAGQAGVFRLRTHSIQLARCRSSPSGRL